MISYDIKPFKGNPPPVPQGRARRVFRRRWLQLIDAGKAYLRGTFVHSHKGRKKRQHRIHTPYRREVILSHYKNALKVKRDVPGLFQQ